MSRLNLSAWALQHRALTLFAMLAVAVAGAWAYLSLGRAEDPPFTIKQMVVVVDWPGASADEMAREVTDRIERKLEDLPHLDHTESQTQPGHAVVTVSLRDDTPPRQVPDLWYQVRKKIGDIARHLAGRACRGRSSTTSSATSTRHRLRADRRRLHPARAQARRGGRARAAARRARRRQGRSCSASRTSGSRSSSPTASSPSWG